MVDDDVPFGWVDADGAGCIAPVYRCDTITAVGSQLRPGGTLSQALDAALSSPSAVGVAVDSDGKVIGGIRRRRCAGRGGSAPEGLIGCTIC